MSPEKTPQTMKPTTAAKKLGIYLPAAPAEFQEGPVTRDALNTLLQSPPEWLVTERATQAEVRAENRRVKDAKLGKAALASPTGSAAPDEE